MVAALSTDSSASGGIEGCVVLLLPLQLLPPPLSVSRRMTPTRQDHLQRLAIAKLLSRTIHMYRC